ncbi:MAG: 30S ribosomal protein S1 [Planctomycetaceae bacterium]|nr:MAG: 30S ribosomal protein S1 [Planctomycetaceae bacterium]
MVDLKLINNFDISDEELKALTGGELSPDEHDEEQLSELYLREKVAIDVNSIVEGTVVRIEGDEVLVDIGYKSEGHVPLDEWDPQSPPKPGDKVAVLLEEIEDEFSLIILSKRKADRIRQWEEIVRTKKEGDVVKGIVQRKIKGGLLVNIGVNVFLPASQVDIRRPNDIGDYIGKEIECVILKIDEPRRNIVVSRRKLLEQQRESMRQQLLAELQEGQIRKGVVKNIAPFGAFIDLGGIDGLLHVTDMSWTRIDDPTKILKIDEEIEVKILTIDRVNNKIALGLKQKGPSPWDNIEEKYPVGSKVKGTVVSITNYGAFVKLEDAIEGLVHISEMSWVKRLNHPSDMVNVGDEVEVVVLAINKEKHEISLGMKQVHPNPWENLAERYPPGAVVTGTVRNLMNFGAFIELEDGIDGLLHVSDISWTKKISHASEVFKKGDQVKCVVLSVDQERRRIGLGMKQLQEDPWENRILNTYKPGTTVTGKITKVTNFGAFIELEPDLEGLLHASELGGDMKQADQTLKLGQEVEVRILRVDPIERKIALTRKSAQDIEALEAREAQRPPRDLKGGTDASAGPLFKAPSTDSSE